MFLLTIFKVPRTMSGTNRLLMHLYRKKISSGKEKMRLSAGHRHICMYNWMVSVNTSEF